MAAPGPGFRKVGAAEPGSAPDLVGQRVTLIPGPGVRQDKNAVGVARCKGAKVQRCARDQRPKTEGPLDCPTIRREKTGDGRRKTIDHRP